MSETGSGRRSRAQIYSALARNTSLNAVGSAIVLVAELAQFVLLIRLLESAAYGMLIVALALVGQFAFLDLGLGRGLERFLPEFRSQGRDADVPRALAFSLLFHLVMGALVGAAILGFAVLGGGTVLAPDDGAGMRSLLIVAGCTAPVLWSLRTGAAALVGLDRLGWESLVQALLATTRCALLAFGARQEWALSTLLAGALALEAGAGILRLVLVARLWQGPLLAIDSGLRAIASELFGYSAWIGLHRLVITASNGFDRLIVSALLGPAAVPVYWIAMRLVRVLPGLIGSIAKRAVMPIASELHAGGGDTALHALVLRGTRGYTAFMLAIVVCLVVYAEPILRLLGGDKVAAMAWAAQVSLLMQAFVIARGILNQAAVIKTETARDSAFVGMSVAAVHLVLLAWAADRGELGLAIVSWSVAHLLFAPWWISRMARHVSLPVARFYGAALRGAGPLLALLALHAPLLPLLSTLSIALQGLALGASLLAAVAVAWWGGLDRPSRHALLVRLRWSRHPSGGLDVADPSERR